MTFFSLITSAGLCIVYGIITTAVIMTLLYAILRLLSKGIVQTPVFYATGVVLAVMLIVQASLMIGAMQAKSTADDAEAYISQMLDNSKEAIGAQDMGQQLLDAVTEEYPIIGSYLETADISVQDASQLPTAIHESVTAFLNSYIWHRIWWMLGVIVIACIISICFEKKGKTSNYYSDFEKYTES